MSPLSRSDGTTRSRAIAAAGRLPGTLQAVVPLKAGLAGGGSDLPSYYRRAPGRCLNLGLDVAMTVTLDPTRPGTVRFVLPRRVDTALGEAVVAASGLGDLGGVEVRSAGVPGWGLGCSSALVVGVTVLRRALSGRPLAPAAVAEDAWRIEAEHLGLPVGRQDHYASALGGVNDLEFGPRQVRARRPRLSERGRALLDGGLLIAGVGVPRRAADILRGQDASCHNGHATVTDTIARRVALVPDFQLALGAGDVDQLARLMRQDWTIKARMAPGIYGDGVEAALERAMAAGALAGRLLGAGGSGYLLLLSPPARRAAVLRRLTRDFEHVLPVAPARHGAAVKEVVE